MNPGFLSLLQFLIDPLQYFSITRIGIIPGIYLGRFLTIILFFSLLLSRGWLRYLVQCFKTIFFSKPYCYFVWLTIIAAIPPLFSLSRLDLIIRFSFIEPLANIIYIAIFAVLPSLASSLEQRRKFSALIFPFVSFILFIGYIDFFSSVFEFNLLGRSLFDRAFVGPRFHSLFHEPRDYGVASIYLASLLFICNLSPLSKFRVAYRFTSISSLVIILLFLSSFLTKSASFAVSLLLFLFFLLFFLLFSLFRSYPYVDRLYLILIVCVFAVLFFFIFTPISLVFGERVSHYYLYLTSLFTSFDIDVLTANVLNIPILIPQASTFLPLFAFLNSFSFDSLYYILFGYGHGYVSSFMTTNVVFDTTDIYNSYAGLPRILCETGVLGFASFAYMYFGVALAPLRSFSTNVLMQSKRINISLYLLFVFLLFCAYLAHRRQEIFLCMGFINCYLAPNVVSCKSLEGK